MKRLTILFFSILISLVAFGRAHAQAPAPIQTSQGSYKALNPYSEWNTKLTQAQKCTENQPIYIAQPSTPGKYPVLVYLHATYADWGNNSEGQKFVQLAAAQGFVAAAFTYDSWVTLNVPDDLDHGYCMFDQSHTGNATSVVCALAAADCSHGLLVSGFSQGGAIAVASKNFNSNINAVWAIGVNGPNVAPMIAAPQGTRALPNNKLLINLGQADVTTQESKPADFSNLQVLTGDSCGMTWQCMQADGSGYYVVLNSQVADHYADHCYWQSVTPGKTSSCTLTLGQLDPGFQPPATNPWSMISNLNWLRAQLK